MKFLKKKIHSIKILKKNVFYLNNTYVNVGKNIIYEI